MIFTIFRNPRLVALYFTPHGMSLGICLKVTPGQSQQIIFQQNLGSDIAPAHCVVQGTRGECCPVFGDAELRLFECCVKKQVSSHCGLLSVLHKMTQVL